MRILHTSDWHLGHRLFGKSRTPEYVAFLDWLLHTLINERIDALLVAGDIFDSAQPGNQAQKLYYDFLVRVAATACRHIVLIAGNHDSPSLVDAPRAILAALNIHVVGAPAENPGDEVFVLRDHAGVPELIICAVPFLRDQDLRQSEAGESAEDKRERLLQGIARHYQAVFAVAGEQCRALKREVPIIAMGHLFAAGGHAVEGDGSRELYVGALAQVEASLFPQNLAYVALGHLHSPQRVGGRENVRYSGAPLAMNFGERGERGALLVDMGPESTTVRLLPTPIWQRLEQVQGDWPTVQSQVQKLVALAQQKNLAASGQSIWLEVICTDANPPGDLRSRLEHEIVGQPLDILRIRIPPRQNQALAAQDPGEELAGLSESEVFSRLLDARAIPEEARPPLWAAYNELLQKRADADLNAG